VSFPISGGNTVRFSSTSRPRYVSEVEVKILVMATCSCSHRFSSTILFGPPSCLEMIILLKASCFLFSGNEQFQLRRGVFLRMLDSVMHSLLSFVFENLSFASDW